MFKIYVIEDNIGEGGYNLEVEKELLKHKTIKHKP